jgi:V/A-type H+-transporting ATPase subunit E
MNGTEKVSNNVQALIDRLRDEGVKAGKEEAAKIVQEAKDKAAAIVKKAQEEAEEEKKRSIAAIREEKEAAEAALRIAVRDSHNVLQEQLTSHFAAQIKRLAAKELKKPEFLKKVILAIAGKVGEELEQEESVELLINTEWLGGKEGGEKTAAAKADQDAFLTGLTTDMLRKGVTLRPAGIAGAGLKIRLGEGEVEVDLTDNALSEMILKYLTPRFRQIIEGLK